MGHTWFFQKRRFQDFTFEILRMVSLLGEEFIFSTPLGQQNFQNFQTFSIYSCCPPRSLSRTISIMLLVSPYSLYTNVIINSGQKDVEVFCVALVTYKLTIILKINDPSAKYVNLKKKILIIRRFGLSPSSGMVVRKKYFENSRDKMK